MVWTAKMDISILLSESKHSIFVHERPTHIIMTSLNSKAPYVNTFNPVKIDVYNKQKKWRISKRAVKNIVQAVIAFEKQICNEVTVHFVSTKKICALHEEYFNDPSPTDCISFPMDDNLDNELDYRILGEVFVCPQTAIDYANTHGVDSGEECTLYIVHGLLHLMGYEDLIPSLKTVMRRAEKKHMAHLKKLNLLLKR